MEPEVEITIPKFVSPHLFWIIPKKNILLRSVMNKIMHQNPPKKEKCSDAGRNADEMVAVNVNDLWARAVIEDIIQPYEDVKYLCWLPDYGVMQAVNYVFELPTELQKCPHLAKQASLFNVVNLRTDLKLGDNGYEVQFKKTTDDIPGVRKASLDFIEDAQKILFSVIRPLVINEDEFNVYGDVICVYQEGITESLTTYLMKNNLMGNDEDMFNTIETSRHHLKEEFFSNSSSWEQDIDRIEERKLSNIIFNQNKSISMDFFKRMAPLNELLCDD